MIFTKSRAGLTRPRILAGHQPLVTSCHQPDRKLSKDGTLKPAPAPVEGRNHDEGSVAADGEGHGKARKQTASRRACLRSGFPSAPMLVWSTSSAGLHLAAEFPLVASSDARGPGGLQ